VAYKFSLEIPKELADKQLRDYEDGKYKLLRLRNHSVPYYPKLEKKDSDAIQNADTESYLFKAF